MTAIHQIWLAAVGSAPSPRALALRRILAIRAIAMTAGLGFVAVASGIYGQSPALALPVLLGVGVLSVVLGVWRFRFFWPVTHWELFGQLLFDIGLLAAVFAYTGGAGNPFISYLLVLLAIAAATLPRAMSIGVAVVAIAVYSGLMVYGLSAMESSMHGPESFRWHLLGMWAIFGVSAMLIAYAVSTLAMEVQKREAGMTKARERVMRNEQVVAVGALAAGVAHGLGTPLNTMAVLLNDMNGEAGSEQWRKNVQTLRAQVQRCREELRRLADVADHHKQRQYPDRCIGDVVTALRHQVALTHPGCKLVFDVSEGSPESSVTGDPTLVQALANLLENAIQAAVSEVHVVVAEVAGGIQLSIVDDGAGIAPQILEQLGEPFLSARSEGLGLGFFLANATIERLGGSIEVFSHQASGTQTVVRLPAQKGEGSQ